LIGELEI